MKVLRWCIRMALLMLPCAGALGAPTVGELIREGNGLYESGDFAAALEKYTEAAKLDPGALEPLFNQACALYRLGRFAEASDALRRVESAPDRGSANDEMPLSTAARYNLGRIAMDLARQQLESDPSAALVHLREAERSFRRVLDEVPGDEDAARNLELARRSIRTVEQLIRQMQSLREQFLQQQEQAAEQFAQLAERQRRAAERSRELEQQQNSPSDPPPEQLQEQMQEAEQEQESISRQTQDFARMLDQIQQMLDQQQQLSPEQREAAEQAIDDAIASLEEAMDDQAAAEQALQENRPADAGEAQQQAADRIQDALEQLAAAAQQQFQQQTPQQGQGEQQSPPQEQQAGEQEGQDPRETGDLPDDQEFEAESTSDGALEGPAQDIAQQILDREHRNREARRAAAGRSGTRKNVEKDW